MIKLPAGKEIADNLCGKISDVHVVSKKDKFCLRCLRFEVDG